MTDETMLGIQYSCLVKAFKPEKFVQSVYDLAHKVLEVPPNSVKGSRGFEINDLGFLYLICSPPGYDVSNRVESLARERNLQLETIAMGSNESIGLADLAINNAIQRNSGLVYCT